MYIIHELSQSYKEFGGKLSQKINQKQNYILSLILNSEFNILFLDQLINKPLESSWSSILSLFSGAGAIFVIWREPVDGAKIFDNLITDAFVHPPPHPRYN